MDGLMDGRTDGPTDGRTDGQTHPLIEMRGASKNDTLGEKVTSSLAEFLPIPHDFVPYWGCCPKRGKLANFVDGKSLPVRWAPY